jgi:hypothetical protein
VGASTAGQTADVSIPAGWNRLHQAGNFHNLELAAGRTTGDYVNDLPFSGQRRVQVAGGGRMGDSPIRRWIPSLADLLATCLAETERLLRDAQQPDGYLDSHFQVRFPGETVRPAAMGTRALLRRPPDPGGGRAAPDHR